MSSNSANAPKANILVVDDTPDNLRLLSAMLTERGYKIRKALNGQTALKTVQTALPDLILLDINMPGMTGYEVCQQLKVDAQTQTVPIIFISALNDVLDKVKAFSVGGADYITKPFQSEEVLARVEHQLTIQHQQKQLQAQNEQLQQEVQERERALKEQEKAEAALRVFLHAVSHDLRNPVIGMSMVLRNLLKHQKATPNAEQGQTTIAVSPAILERMGSSCDRQLSLINSLVETKEFEVWGVPLQCQSLKLHRLGQQLADAWKPMLEQHQANLENHMTDTLPAVSADQNQLWRVFENLIANALKHNPNGVTIVLNAEAIEPSHAKPDRQSYPAVRENETTERTSNAKKQTSSAFVRCSIADDGVGMEPQQCSELFELYKRGESARKTQGLGLGLYLCRQIINAHGGEIGAIANPGIGTQFWFTLPIASESVF